LNHHCTFSNNLRGDDYLNIIRTNFNLQNITFENTKADALDSDFCTGSMDNIKFLNIGNDALDLSGSKLEINNVDIFNPGDKGLSVGENSYLVCHGINIVGGEIAVVSKDNSVIIIDDIIINSSKLAYCAFQKKPEFGHGEIEANNSIITNVQQEYLIEKGSTLIHNGKLFEGSIEKVNEMLYGQAYGKASK